MRKEYHLSIEGVHTKGQIPFPPKMKYHRVRCWTSGRSPLLWNFVEYPPGLKHYFTSRFITTGIKRALGGCVELGGRVEGEAQPGSYCLAKFTWRRGCIAFLAFKQRTNLWFNWRNRYHQWRTSYDAFKSARGKNISFWLSAIFIDSWPFTWKTQSHFSFSVLFLRPSEIVFV